MNPSIRTSGTFRILVLADFHVGSMFGIWPEGFRTSLGTEVVLNTGQSYLLRNWLTICDLLPKVDLLVLNGDMIDGKQPASKGRFVLEPEPFVQAQAAFAVLDPIMKKFKKVPAVVMRGTAYHEDDDVASEWLGQALNAERDENGHYSHDWFIGEWNGVIVDFAHSQSFTTRYRTMPVEREGQFSDMAGIHADVIVRSHSHELVWAYTEGSNRLPVRLSISTPPMEISSQYARRSKTPNRMVPRNLGVIVISIERDKIPCVMPFLFPHPPISRKELL